MSKFDEAKSELAEAMLQLGRAAERLGSQELAQICWGEIERLREGRLLVVVCGEFKMGKSTLINALLDSPDLLPADFDIATASMIMVREGPVLKSFVAPADGGAPIEIPPGDIAKAASETARDRSLPPPRAVLVEAPAPFLRSNLTLVDTPGVSGLSRGHSEITFSVIGEADIVLFASDAQSPLNTSELSFIEKRILPLNRSFALVQTKIDVQPGLDRVIVSNRDKLTRLLGADPVILPVSSRNKLEFLRSRDARDLSDSGFGALEAHVHGVIERGGQRRIISRAAEAAQTVAQRLLEPRKIELVACRGEGTPEFIAMKRQLEETAEHLARLRQDHSAWRNRLSIEMNELRERVVTRGLARRLIEVSTEFRAAANSTTASGDELLAIAQQLEEGVKHAFVTACREIADGADQIRLSIATETSLPLSAVVIGAEPTVRSAPTLDTSRTTGFMTKTGDWANQWRRTLVGGATLGAIAGGILGAIGGFFAGGVGAIPGFFAGMQMGAAVGAAGGGIGGIPSANKFVREKGMSRARDTLEATLGPYFRLAEKECTDHCHALIAEVKQALTREFELRIKDHLVELNERNEALRRGLTTEREAMKSKADRLAEEVRLIEAPRMRAARAASGFAA